jgi:protein gp37
MADKSAIEWTDASWNPLRARNASTAKVGWFCTHVSEGCRNCYAEGFNRRLGTGVDYKPQALKSGQVELFLDPVMLTQPLRWKKPRMIFVCSMTDLFADFVTDDQLDQIWAVIALACTRHTFQILTKRPERMQAYLTDPAWAGRVAAQMLQFPAAFGDYVPSTLVGPLPSVWLGVSVEDQARADERIPVLLDTPAAVRWISAEPLLGPVNLGAVQAPRYVPEDHETDWKFCALSTGAYYFFDCGNGYTEGGDGPDRETRIDWVVAGGESGPGARPMHPDWARQLRDQCAAAGVPFLFKQWGEYGLGVGDDAYRERCATAPSVDLPPMHRSIGPTLYRVGKKAAGRLLDGVLHDEFPAVRS